MKRLKIGLAGLGTVGRGVYELLTGGEGRLRDRCGASYEIIWAGVKRPSLRRPGISRNLRRGKPLDLLRRQAPDILIEVTGGLQAGEWVLEAMRRGADVVTANKLLLASRGPALFREARALGREIRFEASVAGGLPVILALREGLVANKILALYGILNGTTNYILSEMEKGSSFAEALTEAKARGFAEADPGSDLSGKDALYKISILAGLAFGGWLSPEGLPCRGIEGVEPDDLAVARDLGYVLKLLGSARKTKGGKVDARVEPCLVPASHSLATLGGTLNAVSIHSEPLGSLQISASGAGSGPTASAVAADVAAIIARRACGGRAPLPPPVGALAAARGSDQESPYFIRALVRDRPGVLSSVAGALGSEGVSIATARQDGKPRGRAVPLILTTHPCAEGFLRRAVSRIEGLAASAGRTLVCRVATELAS